MVDDGNPDAAAGDGRLEPADAARLGWGLTGAVRRHELGVNKAAWRVGGAKWLYREPVRGADRIARLHRLMTQPAVLAMPFEVPRPLPTLDGDASLRHGGDVWWLADDVSGRHPAADDPADMELVVGALAVLHRHLRQVPRDRVVSDVDTDRAVDRAAELLSALPFDPGQREVVRHAVDRYRSQAPPAGRRQVVHGDPSNPNVVMSTDTRGVRGFLDWDGCRWDSVLADLATVAQTLVLRAAPRAPSAAVLGLVEREATAYREAGGAAVTPEDILVGLLGAKLESVSHHGARYLAGDIDFDLVASQPAKILRVERLLDEL
jgi:aminoglycoside phosphotransferase (APT) family kinase protein